MGTFTSAMGISYGFGRNRSKADAIEQPIDLHVFERLQHFGDEVFTDLDEAGVFGLLQGVDQLAIGTLQVAFDHVVLEVVDALRLVLHALVAPAGGRRLGIGGERAARGPPEDSEKSHSDDELHVASPYGEPTSGCSDNPQVPW